MINSENAGSNPKDLPEKEPVQVVLADDDKDDREVFIEALDAAKIPAEVTTVENGQELMDHLKDDKEPKPDIIFTDINMPVKGGKEVLKEIKQDEELKKIPTVMLSTSDHPKDIQDTFENGANLFIKKPNSFTNFIFILKKVFTLFWTKALLNPVKKIFFISEKVISQENKQ